MRPATRSLLVGALLCAGLSTIPTGCDHGEFGIELAAERVVLTPGGSATVRVDISRPHFGPATRLRIIGLPPGVEATLSETQTDADHVLLTLTAPQDALAQELAFTVKARVGPHIDTDPMAVSVQVPTAANEGLEEYAPGVDGVVETLTIEGQEITFEVVDGVAVTHGDIVLGDAQTLRDLYPEEGEEGFRSATCNFGFSTEFTCARWTDGVIGYTFANNWGDEAENLRMRTLIEDAMAHWEANTGIRFVQRNFGQYLEFRDGGGCSSNVGRAVITGFDSQSISLSNEDCDRVGIAIHEIGHAVGLYHEQSRDDRDDSVVVDFGRVRDGKLHNFFQWGEYERDIGPYDYNSIMHYPRWAFARNRPACEVDGNLAECTILPDDPTANIGQRVGLSEGDILGAYTLYPPQYTIQGATSGQTGDRFFLSLDYDTPVPDADRIEWSTNRAPGVLGRGHSLNLQAIDVPDGINQITARFAVAGVPVTSTFIVLNVTNGTPMVTLAANNGFPQQQLGQPFTVSATVNDAEDGSCPNPLCEYTWTPTPNSGPTDTRVGSFRFHTAGPQTITLEVEDPGGALGVGTLTVDVVNTAPTATIVAPSGDTTLPDGASLFLEGTATDPNSTSGSLFCSALQWSSSNAADVFSPSATGCAPRLEPSGIGTRTVTLTATDPQGLTSDPDTVTVTVDGCPGGNCPPTAVLSFLDPDPSNTYFLELPMPLRLTVGDVESASVSYELIARRAGSPDVVLRSGNASVPGSAPTSFDTDVMLGDDIADWALCSSPSQHRDYDLVFTVDDGAGGVTTQTEPISVGCTLI